ncbi:MAG: hypothetical protein HY928_16865 [Elusimicrobia bacterium]|nr:hypothetical protein [Elusimicrobiota bacterium]
MRRLLFLLHGVGEHGSGWADRPEGPATVLRQASRRYAAFQRRPLDDRAALVPLSYEELLDEAAARWRGAAAAGARRIKDQAQEAARKAAELLRKAPWLSAAADGLSPLAESFAAMPGLAELAEHLPALEAAWPDHASDVLAWRADAACRAQVRAKVADGVRGALLGAAEDGSAVEAVFAAHSLGTAVAHDALDDLGRRWLQRRAAFSPRRWRWRAVFMLADVSRMLAAGGPGSLLRAGPAKDPESWARRLYEVRHAWDPIDRAVPKADGALRRSRPLCVRHAWRANVHSFGHYLEHPAVHIALLRSACGPAVVTKEEEAEALRDAESRPSVVTETGDSLKAKVDAGAQRVRGLLDRGL